MDEENDEVEQMTANIPKTVELVLDMCTGYEGCTVNMDCYYSSPQVAIALRNKNICS